MELFRWSKDYSVNSKELDDQHKKLFEITNRLYTAFSNNEHRDKLSDIISDLHDYTSYHFTEEEKLLKSKGEPLSHDHKMAHKEFIDKIADFKAKFESGRIAVTYEMMNFLSQWLTQHIKGIDKKYAPTFTQPKKPF